jgi:gliding motility-associated-like protein
VELPNVFTPNNDGKNDYFLPMPNAWDGISSHFISIFNRWGEKVWESDHMEEGWDGRRDGTAVADGTYFWVLEVFYGPENIKQVQKGTVTVIGSGY